MTKPKREFELAEQVEPERWRRGMQLLINIAEPDPEYQPFLFTDEASLLDAVGADEGKIQRRLLMRISVLSPVFQSVRPCASSATKDALHRQ